MVGAKGGVVAVADTKEEEHIIRCMLTRCWSMETRTWRDDMLVISLTEEEVEPPDECLACCVDGRPLPPPQPESTLAGECARDERLLCERGEMRPGVPGG